MNLNISGLEDLGSSAQYTFNFKNNSNIDLPYLIFHIIIPGEAIILNADWTKEFINLQTIASHSQCSGCKFYKKIVDPETGMDYFIIDLIGKNISPNESVQLNLLLKPTNTSDFQISTFYDVEDTKSFLANTLEIIEKLRIDILSYTNYPNDSIYICC